MGASSGQQHVSGRITFAQHVVHALEVRGVVGLVDLGELALEAHGVLLGVNRQDHVALPGLPVLVITRHGVLL